MKIDKQNGPVAFNDQSHRYWDVNDESKQYTSVTTLIGKYGQPFDEQFWSAYKALQKLIPSESWIIEKKSLLSSHKYDPEILSLYDISELTFNQTQQAILDDWAKNRDDSCERGTKIHADIENSFYLHPTDADVSKFGVGGKFECKKNYTPLDLNYGVYPEYLIYYDSPDGLLHIAGQIDLLIKNGNEITIVDHKTNKKIDLKGGFDTQTKTTAKMQYPLNRLEDCNFLHYTLQLSTYAWMLQQLNPEFVIKDLILNHYDHEGNNKLYHCEYLKDDIENMLRHYKGESVLAQKRNKRKRIEY